MGSETVYFEDEQGYKHSYGRTPWRNKQLIHALEFQRIGEKIELLQQYEPRSDDVWICNFPKAGTNWLYEIVSMLSAGQAEPVGTTKGSRMIEVKDLNELAEVPSPRILNTHLNLELLPPAVFKTKVIYSIRNPLSVACSYYRHHMLSANLYPVKYTGSVKEYMWALLRDKVPDFDASQGLPLWGSWFTQVPAWWKAHGHTPNILFVFYEELIKNPLENIKTIAKFLEKEFDEEFYQKVVQMTRIETMKKTALQKQGAEYLTQIFNFFQKGELDEWKNHFNEEDTKEFMTYYREKLKSTPDLVQRIQFE